jgi:LysM repeat protein
MLLRNPFKLEKLKINVYGNRRRAGLPQQTFKVMFNPASFSMKHQNDFQKEQGIDTSGRSARYSYSRSDELTLELILDGTGVGDFGAATLLGLGAPSVAQQVDKFLDLCFYMDGTIHEPKFLNIQWGVLDFDCRLQAVDIKYTQFDKTGMPLRAELTTVFIEDLDPAKRVRKEGKSSPDLTHSRIVKKGDTLPLLAKEIYGSAAYYLWVAQANKLDNFRNLTPGQELYFPPLPTEQ